MKNIIQLASTHVYVNRNKNTVQVLFILCELEGRKKGARGSKGLFTRSPSGRCLRFLSRRVGRGGGSFQMSKAPLEEENNEHTLERTVPFSFSLNLAGTAL